MVGISAYDLIQTLAAKNCSTAQRGNHPMWVRKPSAAQFAHSAEASIVVLSDDIALREGGV
jgi:hypothetical protein